jgi:hypothetical protein
LATKDTISPFVKPSSSVDSAASALKYEAVPDENIQLRRK